MHCHSFQKFCPCVQLFGECLSWHLLLTTFNGDIPSFGGQFEFYSCASIVLHQLTKLNYTFQNALPCTLLVYCCSWEHLQNGAGYQVSLQLEHVVVDPVGSPCGPGAVSGLKGAATALPALASLSSGLGKSHRWSWVAKLLLQTMHMINNGGSERPTWSQFVLTLSCFMSGFLPDCWPRWSHKTSDSYQMWRQQASSLAPIIV